MGVYINMEMPISCERCPMLDWDLDYIKCKVTDRHFKMTECWRSIRVPDCPLIPVPPHGRLIDADALHELFEYQWHHLQVLNWNGNPTAKARQSGINWCISTMRDSAPTIIPSEEGE